MKVYQLVFWADKNWSATKEEDVYLKKDVDLEIRKLQRRCELLEEYLLSVEESYACLYEHGMKSPSDAAKFQLDRAKERINAELEKVK